MSARAWLLALAGLTWLHGFAAEPSTTPIAPAFHELMRLLAARRQGHVSFTEVHEMAMLKAPLASSGELLYEAPARLEKRTLIPKPETLVLDHGVLTAQRGHRQHILELGAYPQVVPFVESIRATLAGDEAALEHYFVIDFSGELAHWSLQLTPRDATIARTVAQVTLSGERDAIRTVEIRERDGDRSLLTLGPEITP
jgi:hypothetical protein